MKRNEQAKQQRVNIVKTAINNPNEAADYIVKQAEKIRKSQGTTEIVANLSTLLCVSESTLFKDVQN